MPEFWMCLMQYILQGHCTNYWAVIKRIGVFRTLSNIWDGCFAERIMPKCTCITKNVSGQRGGGFVELGDFNKHFVKTPRKRGSAENILGIFLLEKFWISSFWMENLTKTSIQSGTFFPKSGHFFQFSKKLGLVSPCPHASGVPVSVTEYSSISLNLPKHFWMNSLDYARTLIVYDHCLCSTDF